MRNQFRGNLVLGEETFEKEETFEIVKETVLLPFLEFRNQILHENFSDYYNLVIILVIITIFLLSSNKKQQQQQQKSEQEKFIT